MQVSACGAIHTCISWLACIRAGSVSAPSVATWQSTRIHIPGPNQCCVATEEVVDIRVPGVHMRPAEWSGTWDVGVEER